MAGKTTFADALALALRQRGWQTTVSKGKIGSAPWHGWLARFDANTGARSGWLNAAYLLSALADRLLATARAADQIHITESYVDRAIAYGLAFRLGPVPRIARRCARLYHRFDLAILLLCPNGVRERRYLERPAPSRIDLMTIDPHIAQRFQDSYRQLMPRHRRHIEIDTSMQSLHDTVAATVGLIEQSLVRRRVAPLRC